MSLRWGRIGQLCCVGALAAMFTAGLVMGCGGAAKRSGAAAAKPNGTDADTDGASPAPNNCGASDCPKATPKDPKNCSHNDCP